MQTLERLRERYKKFTNGYSTTVTDYVTALEAEIERLHNQYAHEGGKPQIMTTDIARKWFRAIDVPIMTDIFQTSVPNVFYATFALMLSPEHKMQIKALGFEVIYPDSPLRNRYMLKWLTPPNDEYP